jgi:site-specific DNA recombinase
MKVRQRPDRLYEAVEKGLLSLDPTLTERAHKLGAQRQAILTEITGIKREQEIPLKAVAERNVDGFCRALKEKLLDRASSFGKEYLKLLVDRIEVQRRRVSIRGSYSALAMALKTTKRGEPVRVPSLGGGWLPE